MLYTVDCPLCGAEQKNLGLEETGGPFICSKCGEQVNLAMEKKLTEAKAHKDTDE